ncbi:MAG: hypothetical protein RLY21_587 [Planctomycetota bacterium]
MLIGVSRSATVCCLAAWVLAGCAAQRSVQEGAQAAGAAVAAPAFPADWCGRWTGTLAMLGDSKFGPVTMTLEIAPVTEGRWSWTITYDGEFGRQVRPYELVAIDAAAGRFAVDEKNGIVIPMRVLDGTLYSTFEVMDSRIEMRETLVGSGADAAIVVEMATVRVGESTVTGGDAGRSIPEVRCWTPRSVQRGRLVRR